MEEFNESVSLAHLLSDQQHDFDSLKRHACSLRTFCVQERKESVLNHRAEFIRHLWIRCQERNAQIYRLASAEEKAELSYFISLEFGTIENTVFEALNDIVEHTSIQEQQFLGEGQVRPGGRGISTNLANVKLPRINLITFSGLFTEWQTFRDTFVSLVKNNSALNAISKLHYLRSSLAGDALDLISHVDITATNFEVAWKIILKQYDNKIALVNVHLNALFAVEPIKRESPQGLSALRHAIKKHLGALKSLGRQTDGYDDILINRVVASLDPRTKRDWELQLAAQSNYSKYEELDNFLLERIRALESLGGEADSIGTASQAISKQRSKANSFAVRAYHATIAGSVCVVCGDKHAIFKCNKFKAGSVSERYELVRKHRLCINCLRPAHTATACKSQNSCFKCQQRHHTWLHREQPQSDNAKENAHSSYGKDALASGSGMQLVMPNQAVSHFSVADSVRPAKILLATARVWVLSSTGRAVRVRALLDPGSTWTFMSSDLAKL
ncbi:uncharacterized protein [Cardiocondyla obscurior]|uniref:uncharacterized protein n=1 Tax=Cardiocondyla obscurior TaxID=286306 RepID=UPI0039658857